jgi:hypothetical protein
MVYADVNVQGESVHTVTENRESVVVVSTGTGLEINGDITKCLVMSRDQNSGRLHKIKVVYISFAIIEEFQYLVVNLTNQNYVPEEIRLA